MADEWQKHSLAEVIEIIGGGTPKTSVKDYWNGDIPWLSVVDFNKGFRWVSNTEKSITKRGLTESSTVLIKTGDIIISARGTVGAIAQLAKPMAFNQSCYGVRGKKDITDTDFIYYILKHAVSGLKQIAHGAVFDTITRDTFRVIEIDLPPIAEQKAIAAVLGALDDKIELNRRMNATPEAMARALFQSLFVDFDPVRAKLDGRPPAALDPATAALFPDSFVETTLGHIPLGWEVCALSEKIQLLSGGTPKTSEPTYWDGDIPWYSVRDAPSETDLWVIHTDKHVTKLGIANSAAQIFPEKTTIISARGTVGKLALTAVPMAMNQSCYGVRGIPGYGDYFTYYSLREATAQLQQRTHGTVFDTITTETFKTLDCIFPTPKITAAFDKLVEPHRRRLCDKANQAHPPAAPAALERKHPVDAHQQLF